jgi:hypothetical protein
MIVYNGLDVLPGEWFTSSPTTEAFYMILRPLRIEIPHDFGAN